jgi:hypothetical protein
VDIFCHVAPKSVERHTSPLALSIEVYATPG